MLVERKPYLQVFWHVRETLFGSTSDRMDVRVVIFKRSTQPCVVSGRVKILAGVVAEFFKSMSLRLVNAMHGNVKLMQMELAVTAF